jgi:hypothetical protein
MALVCERPLKGGIAARRGNEQIMALRSVMPRSGAISGVPADKTRFQTSDLRTPAGKKRRESGRPLRETPRTIVASHAAFISGSDTR